MTVCQVLCSTHLLNDVHNILRGQGLLSSPFSQMTKQVWKGQVTCPRWLTSGKANRIHSQACALNHYARKRPLSSVTSCHPPLCSPHWWFFTSPLRPRPLCLLASVRAIPSTRKVSSAPFLCLQIQFLFFLRVWV